MLSNTRSSICYWWTLERLPVLRNLLHETAKKVSYFSYYLLNTKWWEWKIHTALIWRWMTISQHLINIQWAEFLSWYYFKELPSSCMNTHLHTYVDQRTLSALGNFCNVCLPQNLFLRWCRNSLSYFQQVRSKDIKLEKNWDFSIYLFTQTASITRRNRRPNRRQASHIQQPPTWWMQWEKSSVWFCTEMLEIMYSLWKGVHADSCFAQLLCPVSFLFPDT